MLDRSVHFVPLCDLSSWSFLFLHRYLMLLQEKKNHRLFFLIPQLLQIAVGQKVTRQVWRQELLVCFEKEWISIFKSTQYSITHFIYIWNALQLLVLIWLSEFRGNIEASDCERNSCLPQGLLLQTWSEEDPFQVLQGTYQPWRWSMTLYSAFLYSRLKVFIINSMTLVIRIKTDPKVWKLLCFK